MLNMFGLALCQVTTGNDKVMLQEPLAAAASPHQATFSALRQLWGYQITWKVPGIVDLADMRGRPSIVIRTLRQHPFWVPIRMSLTYGAVYIF